MAARQSHARNGSFLIVLKIPMIQASGDIHADEELPKLLQRSHLINTFTRPNTNFHSNLDLLTCQWKANPVPDR
jgi:hypothetical protein